MSSLRHRPVTSPSRETPALFPDCKGGTGDVKVYPRYICKFRSSLGKRGFTLLEIIVTIVIAAIMGVFFAQFVYTGVIHSSDPVKQLQYMYGRDANSPGVTSIMESMTANYKSLAAT